MTDENTISLNIKFQQRFSKNLITNILYFILNIAVGLSLVPYFLDTLGLASYGLIPLATSVTTYVTFIIDGMNHSIVRYLTIDLQKGDTENANKTFNSALFGTGLIILFLIPIILAIAWFAPNIFSVGSNSQLEVFILFAFILGSVLLRAWSSNFMAVLFAYNRLDFRNYVNIINTIIYAGLIVVFFTLFTPSLLFVGIAYISAAVISIIISAILSFKVCPTLKISYSLYSRKKFKNMGGLALWVILDLIGLTLNANVALLLTNILLGDVAEAEYSLVMQWSTLIMGIAGLITNTLTPMIYNYYTKGDTDGLIKFSCFSVKCMGLLMIPIIGLIFIFAPQFLELWLHTNQYAYLTPLLWIVIFPVLFRVQIASITTIGIGYGKVKIPALYSLFSGFLNIILTLISVFIFDAGIYGIAVSGAIAMSVFTGLCCPMYMAYILKAPIFMYIKYLGKGLIYFIGFIFIGMLFTWIVRSDSIISCVLIGIVLMFMYLIFVSKILLNSTEKKCLISIIPKTVANKIPKWLQ